MTKAALVAAVVGGTLAMVEGLLLIVLGGLAGLAVNPEGETALTEGYVLLGLGAIVLTAVFVGRRWPVVLAVTTAATAVIGFFVESALWAFAAAFLLAATALVVISKRGQLRFADRGAKPS